MRGHFCIHVGGVDFKHVEHGATAYGCDFGGQGLVAIHLGLKGTQHPATLGTGVFQKQVLVRVSISTQKAYAKDITSFRK